MLKRFGLQFDVVEELKQVPAQRAYAALRFWRA